MYILAVAKQTVRQQLGLLPVGGSHIIFAMSLLKGLTDPNSSQLADQGVLPGQPTLIILHDNTDNLVKRDEEEKIARGYRIM